MFLAHVLAQNPRKRSIGARVRMLLAQDALRRGARAVIVDRGPRLHQRQRYIVFLHAEYGASRESIVLDENIEQGLKRRLAPRLRDVGNGLALQGAQRRILDHADQNRFGSRDLVPFIVPGRAGGFDVLDDTRPRDRVLEALHHFLIAAVVRPRRHERGHVVEPRRIGVGVRGDVETARARRLDAFDHVRHAAPVPLASNLQMPDLHRDMRLAGNAEGFIEGGHHAVPFRAHMRSVDAAVWGGFGSQRDQLFGAGVGRRGILQGRRHADRTLLHGLAHQGPHAHEFRSRGRSIVAADHHLAHRGRADVRGQIDADALTLEAGEVLAQRLPVSLEPVVLQLLSRFDASVSGHRRRRLALPRDFGGDALINLGRQPRVDQDGEFRLPQHVDEAGRDDFPGGVDAPFRLGFAQIADGRNAPVSNADVRRVPR